MKVIKEGHVYEVEFFEDKSKSQTLNFIWKEIQQSDGQFTIVADGTTNEEVLAVLIDRLKFLGIKLPSRETSIAITKLEEALLWLSKRTAERQARGVEGTHKA